MTQEDKELLLKDLCARLPYGILAECGTDYDFQNDITDTVKLLSLDIDSELCRVQAGNYVFNESLDTIKPYLRPMSSMTEEEAEQIIKFICEDSIGANKINIRQDHITAKVDYLIGDPETVFVWFDNIIHSIEILDFLNACHLDYRGLISMRLALEAPEGMYNTKN